MSERKVFEEDGFVVTTERFVHGSDVFYLSEIESAYRFVDRGWVGALIIGGLGLFTVAKGSFGAIVGGVLLLVAAYAFFHFTTTRQLILITSGGGRTEINVKQTSTLNNVISAIERGSAIRRLEQQEALHADLDNLPSL